MIKYAASFVINKSVSADHDDYSNYYDDKEYQFRNKKERKGKGKKIRES